MSFPFSNIGINSIQLLGFGSSMIYNLVYDAQSMKGQYVSIQTYVKMLF